MTNKSFYKPSKESPDQRHRRLDLARSKRKRLRLEVIQWVDSYKAQKGCADCKTHEVVLLEFHHRDRSSKTAAVSVLVATGAGIGVVQKEISLCDVLCANCHKRRHHHANKYERLPLITKKLRNPFDPSDDE